jgi:hypothetical protein
MGFFASFLLLHLHFKHEFRSTGFAALDLIRTVFARLCITGLALVVCYSRYVNHLQILFTRLVPDTALSFTYSPQIFSQLPHPSSNSMGIRHRNCLGCQLLHSHRISPLLSPTISSRTSPDIPLTFTHPYVVPHSGSLGSVGRRRTRRTVYSMEKDVGKEIRVIYSAIQNDTKRFDLLYRKVKTITRRYRYRCLTCEICCKSGWECL